MVKNRIVPVKASPDESKPTSLNHDPFFANSTSLINNDKFFTKHKRCNEDRNKFNENKNKFGNNGKKFNKNRSFNNEDESNSFNEDKSDILRRNRSFSVGGNESFRRGGNESLNKSVSGNRSRLFNEKNIDCGKFKSNSANQLNKNEFFRPERKNKSLSAEGDEVKPDRSKHFKHSEKFGKLEEDADYKVQLKNKCRDVVKFKGGKIEKKPFDKKKWRLQKYSKKYKLEQFEEKRKKNVLREYYKETKEDKSKLDVQKIYEKYDSDDEKPKKNYVQNPDYKPPEEEMKIGKKSTRKKVQLELERIKKEKEEKKKELLRQKQEKEEALREYKIKKIEKNKKLNKKTKRGQPVMKGRIEMLLDKIQNS